MNRKRMSYGLALAAMATILSAIQAYADDSMAPVPATNAIYSSTTITTTTTAAPMAAPGTNTLGVLPANSSAMQPSAMPSSSPRPSSANAMPDDTMRPQQAGNITYMTGGIGDEERSALDAAKPDYNLHIMSANKDGSFIGDENISIQDKKGNTLVNAPAGPLFFAKLPAGSYTVVASSNGKTQQHKLTVGGHGSANLHFSW